MYALNKGHNILAKTRRSLTQKLDNLENQRDHPGKKTGECGIAADMNSPKPVFHQVNGRRSHTHRNHQEIISPQHEEITKYINETWNTVCQEYESTNQTSVDGKVPKVVYYQDKSNQRKSTFQPFDLEIYWGERFLQSINKSS